jgi:twitching motility protein PilT
MACTPAIKALIRDDKVHQVYGIMQAGQKYGMQTMNQSLYEAYVNRRISYDEAVGRSPDKDEILKMIGEAVPAA